MKKKKENKEAFITFGCGNKDIVWLLMAGEAWQAAGYCLEVWH